MNSRAAVVIGVNEGGGLTPLESAAKTAQEIAQWLKHGDPAYDVTLLTDAGLTLDGKTEEPSPVTIRAVERAVHSYVTVPPRYDLLLIYYCGHGLYANKHDVWLLNEAPKFAREVISVNASIDLAQDCGIETVVFVSDACRNTSGKLSLNRLSPGTVFPNEPALMASSSKVDLIRATIKGAKAYEVPKGDTKVPVLSEALRNTYRDPPTNLVRTVSVSGDDYDVVPNRKLDNYLQAAVDTVIDDSDQDVNQIVYVNIPSGDEAFIAAIDPTDPGSPPKSRKKAAKKSAAASAPSGTAPDLLNREPSQSDNLQKIKGIGPKLEQKLKSLGIFFFEQIASWQDDEIAWIEPNLGGFIGRVLRDQWVPQARELATADDGVLIEALITADKEISPPTVNVPPPIAPKNLAADANAETHRILRSRQISAKPIHDFRWPTNLSLPAHFESNCGFSISGARVTEAHLGGGYGYCELLEPGDGQQEAALIRVWTHEPATEAAVVLEDGRSLLLGALSGYLGHAVVDEHGLSKLSYIPSDTSSRWNLYDGKRDMLEQLRGAATAAMQDNQLKVGSTDAATNLGDLLRELRALDPILGLLSAWSYSEAGYLEKIQDVLGYMRSDLNADLFDVRMLAFRRTPSTEDVFSMVPSCPILTQGWHILASRNVELPSSLAEGSHYLTESLYTTFAPGFAPKLVKFVKEEGN